MAKKSSQASVAGLLKAFYLAWGLVGRSFSGTAPFHKEAGQQTAKEGCVRAWGKDTLPPSGCWKGLLPCRGFGGCLALLALPKPRKSG